MPSSVVHISLVIMSLYWVSWSKSFRIGEKRSINAITTAVAMGYTKGDFKKIYVMVSGDKLSTPCFICRQVITEFFDKDSEVVLMGRNGEVKNYKVSDMCPYPFDSEDL